MKIGTEIEHCVCDSVYCGLRGVALQGVGSGHNLCAQVRAQTKEGSRVQV